MPLHSYFVLVAFAILLLVFSVIVIRLSNFKLGIMGTPTIDKLYFYTAKFAIYTNWTLFIIKAIFPSIGYIYLPDMYSWIAVGLLFAGAVILCIAFVNLGNALRFGLPEQETKLQTKGLFSISRNPLYVGVYLIAIGSCLYFPDLLNVSFAIYTIYVHHQIVKREEVFLSERFGSEWLAYSAKVRRYI